VLKNLKTSILYRNPLPHVKSIHAYFPSVAVLPDGEMAATFILGEAFEAVNLHTYFALSDDYGETWTLEGRISMCPGKSLFSDFSRITALPDGELVVLMCCADRTDHPDEGLTNPETLGFVPTQFLLFRSDDYCRTWHEPDVVDSPLGDTSLELCAPIVPLKDGRWIIPTSTGKVGLLNTCRIPDSGACLS
jgi:hypothetical protein